MNLGRPEVVPYVLGLPSISLGPNVLVYSVFLEESYKVCGRAIG
jgi:hypothetical protein